MDPAQNPKADKPLSALMGDLARDLGTLVRQEMQLARAELKDDVARAARAGAMLGAAAVAGYFAGLLLSLAVVFLLDLVMPTWVAFLVVGAVYGAAAAALALRGRKQMAHVNPKPEATLQSVKEDVRWLKDRKG